MEGMWAFVVIGGPIILLVVLVAAWALNRKGSGVSLAETEAATKRVRHEQDVEDKARDGG